MSDARPYLSMEAATALGGKHLIVKAGSTDGEVALVDALTDNVFGVVPQKPKAANEKVRVITPGTIVNLRAAAAIPIGAPIVPSDTTDGYAEAWYSAAGVLNLGVPFGVALGRENGEAIAANDFFLARIGAVAPPHLTTTVGAEAADVISVTLAANYPAKFKVHAHLFDAAMLDALVGAWTMAETGGGAEVSTTAKPGLYITLSATGTATIAVTDVAGASGLTTYLRTQIMDYPLTGARLDTLTFD